MKFFEGRVPRTEYRLTATGRRALAEYLDQMEEWIRVTREEIGLAKIFVTTLCNVKNIVSQEEQSCVNAHIASNMNFPAPLAVLGFLAAIGGLFLAVAAALIFWFARKPKFARITAIVAGAVAIIYFALLLSDSPPPATKPPSPTDRKNTSARSTATSPTPSSTLTPSPTAISSSPSAPASTRPPRRPAAPKTASLTPSPREARLIDSAGREYAPVATAGTPLLTPLKPADSYTTQLEFNLPKDATGLRLLINTIPQWPDHIVIGDENSLLHKKTYFAL